MARQYDVDEEAVVAEQWQEGGPSGSNAGYGMDIWREPPSDRVGPREEDGALHREGPHGIWVLEEQGRDRGGRQGDGRSIHEQEGGKDP
eukprot:12874666-Heterocapsa_arctica.AAC.1